MSDKIRGEVGKTYTLENGMQYRISAVNGYNEITDKILWEAGKEYTLRNGLRVKIDATDRGGDFPIHGAFIKSLGEWVQICFTLSGKNSAHLTHDYDLVPPALPRIKGECWLVVKANRNMIELVAGTKSEACRAFRR